MQNTQIQIQVGVQNPTIIIPIIKIPAIIIPLVPDQNPNEPNYNGVSFECSKLLINICLAFLHCAL